MGSSYQVIAPDEVREFAINAKKKLTDTS